MEESEFNNYGLVLKVEKYGSRCRVKASGLEFIADV